jgi:hypothetical protein
MWRAIWRIELRKTVPYYLSMPTVAVLYVLMRQAPLGCDDQWPFSVAIFMGMWLAQRIFRDASGTEAFVFSLPLSRTRLFWYRWTLGVGMVALTGAAVGVVIATGLRETVQTGLYDSVWYPMVRWRELGILWPLAAGALFGYQLAAFGALSRPLRAPAEAGGRRGPLVVWIVAIVALGGLATLTTGARAFLPGDSAGMEAPQRWELITSPAFIAYLAVLTVLTTASCLWCYRRLEIEA